MHKYPKNLTFQHTLTLTPPIQMPQNWPMEADSGGVKVNQLTRSCYYQLRQLCTVSCSLSHNSAVTLVHAFVTSQLDHCCSVSVGLPLAMTARLDRVLRSAARLIGSVPK